MSAALSEVTYRAHEAAERARAGELLRLSGGLDGHERRLIDRAAAAALLDAAEARAAARSTGERR